MNRINNRKKMIAINRVLSADGVKMCSKCHAIKDKTDFWTVGGKTRYMCKDCDGKRLKEKYRKAHGLKMDVISYKYKETRSINYRKYSLKKDHEQIKKQIKQWEICLGILVTYILTEREHNQEIDWCSIQNELERLSDEMMAINI